MHSYRSDYEFIVKLRNEENEQNAKAAQRLAAQAKAQATRAASLNQQRAALAARESAAQQDRMARLRAFESEHGTTRRVDLESIFANPYALKGKTVSVKCAFRKMLDQSTGLFVSTNETMGMIAVSEIPSGIVEQLIRPGINVVLSIRVRGITELRAGESDVQVPDGKFLGILMGDAITEWKPS